MELAEIVGLSFGPVIVLPSWTQLQEGFAEDSGLESRGPGITAELAHVEGAAGWLLGAGLGCDLGWNHGPGLAVVRGLGLSACGGRAGAACMGWNLEQSWHTWNESQMLAEERRKRRRKIKIK
ncbi:hypothetical protein TIFTF001_017618 [Ficus carica]|uniref:Uncharacterized protein n=1 Tax=Ficus carica TaxID=3494 RepID=A0AA88AAZ2_FICCA|nr:hypothetical protein TIFTF001_017618 [Ficus carica]